MNKNYESNIWKYFVYVFTGRRNFIPLIAIYFMTLPDAKAFQIGLYMGISFIVGFLLELPSGYISDTIGHKRTMFIGRILLFFSTVLFIIGDNFYYFAAASSLMAINLAFQGGSQEAFMYNTLQKINRQKEYSKIIGKIQANASLLSAIVLILLPFLTTISILLPFYIYLIVDLVGIIVTMSFVDVENQLKDKTKRKSLKKIVIEAKHKSFFSVAIFTGSIIGVVAGAFPIYREVYLESLGLPIIFMGFAMGFSRFVWFIVGNYAYKIEDKFTMKQHFFSEIFIFTFLILFIAYFSNPYLVLILMALLNGYMWGREQVIKNYILRHYVSDENYRATILSLRDFISIIIKTVLIFVLAFIMNYSYKLGYYFLALVTFVLLAVSYYFISKH